MILVYLLLLVSVGSILAQNPTISVTGPINVTYAAGSTIYIQWSANNADPTALVGITLGMRKIGMVSFDLSFHPHFIHL